MTSELQSRSLEMIKSVLFSLIVVTLMGVTVLAGALGVTTGDVIYYIKDLNLMDIFHSLAEELKNV